MYKEIVMNWAVNENNQSLKKAFFEMAKKADERDQAIKNFKRYLIAELDEIAEEELFDIVSNQTIIDLLVEIVSEYND